MAERRLFPDGKEVTESFGAYWGVVHHILNYEMKKLGDPTINLISVGDGSTPRTAATFAFRSRWNCISIDPLLKKTEWKIDRLTCYKSMVEDLDLKFGDGKTIIVCVHSHASLKECLKHIKSSNRDLLAIPCCVSYKHDRYPDIEYYDLNIWSPKNLVKIWRKI